MKKLLSLAVPGLFVALFTTGCHIESHDEVGPNSGGDICGSFCLQLFECSSITDDQMGACLDQCNVKLHADTEGTVSACHCVLDDECRAADAYDCPGAPIPIRPSSGGSDNSGSSGGSGNATSAGGTGSASGGASSSGGSNSGTAGSNSSAAGSSSSAGTGGAVLGCQGGYECGASEDCVDGACRQRCTASCQCPTDLSCIEHYCRSAAPPPACSTDCECASGQHCLSGACG